MKRIISLFMSVVLLLSVCSSAAYAEESKNEYSDYPVVVVPGYASSPMYRIDEETGEKIHVWNIMIDEIIEAFFSRIADVCIGIKKLSQGDAEYIAKAVGEEFIRMYGDLACNDDGSSVYDVKRYHFDPAETNDVYLMQKYPDSSFCRFESEIMGDYSQYIGHENIFNFACDFRMGAIACAAELDEYITAVKKYTGKDKVNIFSISHGGQVTGTYLSVYGEKGDVNNAVMTVPALGGSAVIYDALTQNINFDEEELLRFVEYGMMYEEDYHLLLESDCLGFADDILNAFVPYAFEVLGNWGSIWDFVPSEYYEELKAKYLDKDANAEIIAKSDRMHYEIMPNFAGNFKKAQDAGTKISIIAGYALPIVTGSQDSSDGIITTKSSTGAECARVNERFSDGYLQKVRSAEYKVSPAMDTDISCGYLPDNTWLVENMFHGMMYKDPYTDNLLETLLLTDKLDDVNTDPNFPQYHANTSPSSGIWAAFDNSTEGFLSSADTRLTVKNLSKKYKLKILSVKNNAGLSFDFANSRVIDPGETIQLEFSGEAEEASLVKKDVVIDFALIGSVTPLCERTFNFTLMNGDDSAYDETAPYSPLCEKNIIQKYAPNYVTGFLKASGLEPLAVIAVNIVSAWLGAILNLLKG